MSPFITLLTAIKKLLAFKVDRDEFRDVIRDTKRDIEGVKNDIEDTKRDIEDTKRDIKDIVEEVEGNIVQSDWNQNDENAPDHVKNRPFYEDVSLRTVVCREQKITLQDGEYSYFEYDTWTEQGAEYIVVFDGVEYPVVCWSDSDACWRLDFTHTSGVYVTIMDSAIEADGLAGEHTLAVYTNDGIKRIDTKFIPKSVLDDLESLNVSINQKMDVRDPVGTGPLSMNRLSNTTVGACSTTLGSRNRAETNYSHAEGYKTSVTKDTTMVGEPDVNISASYNKGAYGHAEGYGTVVSGAAGHAEGNGSVASGPASHAEGSRTKATGYYSHAEGAETTASGYYSHAEGVATTASGKYSHAEGFGTTASGQYAHAEGYYTTASGEYAHAEGSYTTASSYYSHAEGIETRATKSDAHAEGSKSEAHGNHSHAEGCKTIASGNMSHSEGGYTVAASAYQHTQGKYNIEDADGKYAHIVGNGTSDTDRSNAHTLDWDGNAWYAGTLRVGGTSYDDAKEVALKEDIPQGGSGGGQFRHIRTVVIPEDVSTDTSGVNFLEMPNGGCLFGFDTDENGEPFSLTEILCFTVASSAATVGGLECCVGSSVPSYGSWDGSKIQFEPPVGLSGKTTYGVAYCQLFSNGNSFGYKATFGGGSTNNLQTLAKEGTTNAGEYKYTTIDKLRFYISNAPNYGASTGSTFKFYGR